MRIYREAYLKVGKRDAAWDAAALALLDAVARLEAYRDLPPGWVYDKPSAEQLRAFATAARQGCDDPLVFGICACAGDAAMERGDHADRRADAGRRCDSRSIRLSMRQTWPARFLRSPRAGRRRRS